MLLAPEKVDNLEHLEAEYERKAETYAILTDEVAIRGAFGYLMSLLARIRELKGYPSDYWTGCTQIRMPKY